MDLFMDILGYIASIGVAIFSTPLFIKVLKTKDTTMINLLMMLILSIASFLFVITGCYSGIKMGFTGFGIAVIVANSFAGIVAAIICGYKLINMHIAKKQNITEKELVSSRKDQ